MRAYSNDLRERILRALGVGESVKSVAKRFEVSVCWIYKILARYRNTGNYEALPYSNGAPSKLSEENLQLLFQMVQEHPDASLQELKEKGNFTVSLSTIHRALRNKLNVTYKKKRFMPVNKIGLTSMKREKNGRKKARHGIVPV